MLYCTVLYCLDVSTELANIFYALDEYIYTVFKPYTTHGYNYTCRDVVTLDDSWHKEVGQWV